MSLIGQYLQGNFWGDESAELPRYGTPALPPLGQAHGAADAAGQMFRESGAFPETPEVALLKRRGEGSFWGAEIAWI